MARFFFIVFIAFSFFSCKERPEKIIGIKIYDYSGDYNMLVTKWEEMGINTAFVSSSLSGDEDFRAELKKKDISIFIIFPVFFNPEILSKDSTLYAVTSSGSVAKDEWVEFVCPSRKKYREAMKREISEIAGSLDPDGISIDFIRHFVYWEKTYPDRDFKTIEKACYCDSCLSGFTDKYEIIIPEFYGTVAEKAEWIEKNHSSEWNTYRCNLITSMIRELSDEVHAINKEILINVHIVPWRSYDFNNGIINIAGQDLENIRLYTDYVSPMCYSQMVDRGAEWIPEVVKDMDEKAAGKVLPSIQVYPYYIDRQLTAAHFRLCMEEALKPPSRGVVFFSWPLFEKDSSRMQVVRDVIEQY